MVNCRNDIDLDNTLAMDKIPVNLIAYKKTPHFNQNSVPAGLLASHSTKADVWGKIVILSGRLLYRILQPVFEETLLTPELNGVIQPAMLHEVEVIGPVEFYVEFYRLPND
jgi:tellurite resistance-related uncharacterized protein